MISAAKQLFSSCTDHFHKFSVWLGFYSSLLLMSSCCYLLIRLLAWAIKMGTKPANARYRTWTKTVQYVYRYYRYCCKNSGLRIPSGHRNRLNAVGVTSFKTTSTPEVSVCLCAFHYLCSDWMIERMSRPFLRWHFKCTLHLCFNTVKLFLSAADAHRYSWQ